MQLQDARQLAERLLAKHKLSGWSFGFDNAKLRSGICRYRSRSITLSRHMVLLNDENIVRDTILHEIAHAIVGAGKGHGNEWLRKAVSIGCTGERCTSSDALVPEYPFMAHCPNCKKTVGRFRLPKSRRIACGACCDLNSNGRFDERYVLIWKRKSKYEC